MVYPFVPCHSLDQELLPAVLLVSLAEDSVTQEAGVHEFLSLVD